MALKAGELAAVNLDLPSAITLVLGKIPAILGLRDLARELRRFDLRFFDHLETFVLATAHAHALCLAATARPESIGDLSARASALRDLLYSDADALAKRGLVNKTGLKKLRTPSGYKNLAFDRLGLAVLLRESWTTINGQRVFTLFFRTYDEVRRAVCYLRWNEGDANRIAPSLYVRRRKRPKALAPAATQVDVTA